ncbi:MAG: hypothetical protein AVDCRST_MAG55-3292 [uncultured Rubrobacteraceae bacterium]|uniref:Uncharacterized protein n=1 Tax=uncultured Rubrobacteraceae bacterium TaxID=349277 RepID=A0A6J4QAU5_9ACTN|nr:MAG: hypothetical protein AVDCRST_MAG55-3292 [uncultured Rubrobacteraceae bacterium]
MTGLDDMLAWSYLNADKIGRGLLGSPGWVTVPAPTQSTPPAWWGKSCDLVPAVELLPQHAQGRLGSHSPHRPRLAGVFMPGAKVTQALRRPSCAPRARRSRGSAASQRSSRIRRSPHPLSRRFSLTTTRPKRMATLGNSKTTKSAYTGGLCNLGKRRQTFFR